MEMKGKNPTTACCIGAPMQQAVVGFFPENHCTVIVTSSTKKSVG